ncbi:MAG: rRNA adenine N-6-methyltransferase family protein [Pseudomonadota bacterium]
MAALQIKLNRRSARAAARIRRNAKTRAKTITTRLADQAHFVGALVQSPRQTGAIAPTSRALADQMAAQIDLQSQLPALELGPGTGAITSAILRTGLAPENLFTVEYDGTFCTKLRKQFPGIHVLNGDAFDLTETLKQTGVSLFDCVISGLPLLNFGEQKRQKMLTDVLAILPKGRPLIQFSYGVRSPIAVRDANIRVEKSPWVWRNLPPARIWTYSRV